MVTLKKKLEIPERFVPGVNKITETLKKNGYECYMVGGSVRDMLLGIDADDIDFATNARPERLMQLFKNAIPTGIKHGTVTVVINGEHFEVTTYRCDGLYDDGRRPRDVTFSDTLEADVERRDFTINGIAYDVAEELVIDYPGGIADLEKQIIRTIGDPAERFSEDGLRPYRACRLAAKLNFSIEDKTLNAIRPLLDVASKVSIERVRDEFVKLLQADSPSVGFEYMRRTGLLGLFLPELAACFDVQQNKFHSFDVYYHCLYSCDAAPKDPPYMRLSALLHDIGKPVTKRGPDDSESTFYNHEVIGSRMAKNIMRRLKFPNSDIEKVTNLVVNHMFHYTDEWNDGAVRRFMKKIGVENLNDLITLRLADREGNGARTGLPAPIVELMKRIDKIIEEENAITVRDLAIGGNDIMNEFGVEPGPVIGIILNELLEMVLDNPEVNTREILLEHAREIYKGIDHSKLRKK